MPNDLELETATGKMLVAEYEPTGDPKRAVIVVHEAFGLNNHIREVTSKISDSGYLALAPDFFHFSENAVVGYDDLGGAMGLMSQVDDSAVLSDVDACIEYLGQKGIDSQAIGIMGFCMGGRVVFWASLNKTLGAGVSFYGGGIVTENITGAPALTSQAKNLKTPWLGLFGDMDAMIPVEGVEELRGALEEATVPNEIIRYPDADHGFHCNERQESFNAEVSEDAWERTLSWFQTHLK